MQTNPTLYNELEKAKRRKPVGEITALTGTPTDGKYLPCDGSNLARTLFPELDNVYPSPITNFSFIEGQITQQEYMNSCFFVNNKFIISTDDASRSLISNDYGITWSQNTEIIIYQNRKPAIIGNIIIYSSGGNLRKSDGNTVLLTSGVAPNTQWARTITYGQDIFLCTGSNFENLFYYSEDFSSSALVSFPDLSFYDVAFGNNMWCGICYSSSLNKHYFAKSATAITPESWTFTELSEFNYDIVYGNGIFVFGNGYNIYTYDGVNLNSTYNDSTGFVGNYPSIQFVNGMFIKTAKQGVMSVSYDGIEWTKFTLPFLRVGGVGYGNGIYIIPNMWNSNNFSTSDRYMRGTIILHDSYIHLPTIADKYIRVKS